jgi:hypothetical protein
VPGSPPAPLTAAHVTSLSHRAELPDWQWSDTLSPAECKPEYCDYVLPRHLPLQRVEFTLAQSNTLARVQLLAQPDDEPEPKSSRVRHHHPVREHLKAIRHKNESTPAQQVDTFWPLATGTVYALNLQGSDVRSTVMTLQGGQYRKLRVQPTGGSWVRCHRSCAWPVVRPAWSSSPAGRGLTGWPGSRRRRRYRCP